MKIGVRILPRDEVLDAPGRAVEKTLRAHGYELSACRIGKFVRLEIEAKTKEDGLARAKEIAEFVLHNPLIETFELEVLDA